MLRAPRTGGGRVDTLPRTGAWGRRVSCMPPPRASALAKGHRGIPKSREPHEMPVSSDPLAPSPAPVGSASPAPLPRDCPPPPGPLPLSSCTGLPLPAPRTLGLVRLSPLSDPLPRGSSAPLSATSPLYPLSVNCDGQPPSPAGLPAALRTRAPHPARRMLRPPGVNAHVQGRARLGPRALGGAGRALRGAGPRARAQTVRAPW